MNRFYAKITGIQNSGNLHLVTLDFSGTVLKMISLDLPQKVCEGAVAELSVKPSHVAIAKDFSGEVSYSNRIPARIEGIERGELLSIVTLDAGEESFESLITTGSLLRMELKPRQSVKVMIKASELSLVRIVDEY